jgi:hypothetical protein
MTVGVFDGQICFRCERTRNTKTYERGPLCDFCAQDGYGIVATAPRSSLDANELVPLLESENAQLQELANGRANADMYAEQRNAALARVVQLEGVLRGLVNAIQAHLDDQERMEPLSMKIRSAMIASRDALGDT